MSCRRPSLAWIVVTVSALVSGGCSGEKSTSPVSTGARLTLTATVPLAGIQGLCGSGGIVAASTGTGLTIFVPPLSDADSLEVYATLPYGMSSTMTDIKRRDDWIMVALRDGIALLDYRTPPFAAFDLLLPLPYSYERRCALSGNLLTVAEGFGLTVYDISTPANPLALETLTGLPHITAVEGLPTGALVLFDSAYAYLDLMNTSNISLTPLTSPALRAFSVAMRSGTQVYVAKPLDLVTSQIGRVDMSTPSAPHLALVSQPIQGTFVAFAYEATGYLLLTEDGLGRFHEDQGVLKQTDFTAVTVNRQTFPSFHDWQNRFYFQNGNAGIQVYLFN